MQTRAIITATIGNVIEFYDFLVYGLSAVPISRAFFPVPFISVPKSAGGRRPSFLGNFLMVLCTVLTLQATLFAADGVFRGETVRPSGAGDR